MLNSVLRLSFVAVIFLLPFPGTAAFGQEGPTLANGNSDQFKQSAVYYDLDFQTFEVIGGSIVVDFDAAVIAQTRGRIDGDADVFVDGRLQTRVTLDVIEPGAQVFVRGGRLIGLAGELNTVGRFWASRLGDDLEVELGDLSFTLEGTQAYATDRSEFKRDVFDAEINASLDRDILTVDGTMFLGMSFAEFLGAFDLAGWPVGAIHGELILQPINSEGGFELPTGESTFAGGIAQGGGPDVIVGELNGGGPYNGWGASGGIGAYSIGTTSCNIGTEVLLWQANTVWHPVIPQNMYRLKDDRFEQIGMSWLKHGFCAIKPTSACSTSSEIVLPEGSSGEWPRSAQITLPDTFSSPGLCNPGTTRIIRAMAISMRYVIVTASSSASVGGQVLSPAYLRSGNRVAIPPPACERGRRRIGRICPPD